MGISTEQRQELRQPRIARTRSRSRLNWKRRVRQWVALVASTALFLFAAVFIPLVQILTLFRARRLYAEGLAARFARMGLWLHGIQVEIEGREHWPKGQAVYISNHTSALDAFIIVALGLPNTRYFMGGFLRALIPLWIVASAIGTFWTPTQLYPEKRRRLFQSASKLLARTGESVFLTPEGQICWQFNKGAFHLGISLKAPIVPFFIHIDEEMDPGPWTGNDSFDLRPGRVRVIFRPAVDTSHWSVEQLDDIRFGMRQFYYDWAVELGDKSAEAFEALPTS